MNKTKEASEVALSVKGVSKDFILPHEKKSSIKSAIVGAFRSHDRSVDVQHALSGIDFEVKKGEFFGVLGRNGSGKSTLLKIMAEIYQPTEGTVSHRGKLVPFIELGVGFNPELTGRENVYLNGALLGFSRKEIDARYDEIVEFAELENFMEQKMKNYSSGMQVRLAFSVATRAEADILLIDEVLAVGDASFQRKCYDYFKSLKKQKKTIIFVSHDMSAVREFCDRAVLIDKSKVVASGATETIANKYTQLFLDSIKEEDGSDSNNRWGDGRALYSDISLAKPLITEKDKALQFDVTFEAKRDLESIIAGSSLTTATGYEYCGTNTDHQNLVIKDIKKGEKVTLKWSYPNIFSNGRHYVNLSLHGHSGADVADWWTDAMHFDVRKKEQSPFVVTPDIDIKLERQKSR
jgi:ABC-2 type transport system ATP-binding protein